MWRKGNNCALLVGMQTSIAAWKTVWKLKIELPYDPAIPLLNIYQKERKKKNNFDEELMKLNLYAQQILTVG